MTDFSDPATPGDTQVLQSGHIAHHEGLADGLFEVAVASVTGTYTVPQAAAHDVTMTGNTTFTFTTPTSPNGTVSHSFMLRLSGAFAPTWPAQVKWDGGTAPTYTTPSLYVFTTLDSGTSWLGSQVGRAFA